MPKGEKSTDHDHNLIKSEGWSGCISMYNFRLFPPYVLRKMSENYEFHLFHEVKIALKLEKSTDHDFNLITSEQCQDTSVCKISSHSLNVLSRKCSETTNLTYFTKSTWPQKEERSVLKVVRIRQHAKFQAIPSLHSREMPGNLSGRRDRQPQNTMPPVPKAGGIKIYYELQDI